MDSPLLRSFPHHPGPRGHARVMSAVRMIMAAGVFSCHPWPAVAGESSDFFENRIRPVLAAQCHGCHSTAAGISKGGLKLDSREALMAGGDSGTVVVPGDAEGSLLIKAVRRVDKDLAMPPDGDGRRALPPAVVADFAEWVKMGAPFPADAAPVKAETETKKHWAFEPVTNPTVPAVTSKGWVKNEVDAFIGAKPAPPASPRALIRRMTYDLTGLPPTPEEVEAFVKACGDPVSVDAPAAALVERLLASRRYGEHWGRHWLDVVRYADTAGDTADYPAAEAWRYRNYVIDALNADKPYDEFIREQVAGDIMARGGPRENYAERVTATGYLAISRRFGFDSENYHHLTIQDTIDTLGQSVLGLTLGCARCHNHKFDPVSTTEYYGLYGIFESTRYAFPGSEQKQKYRALATLVPPEESRSKWRELDAGFVSAGLAPAGVLCPLDDIDGNFEMQHAASGGSNGVLVQPWFYDGKVSVTPSAQSPFRSLYPFGGVGVNVAAGTVEYAIRQTLHPSRTEGIVHVNLDFRVTGDAAAHGRHRFMVGAAAAPAVEMFIAYDALMLPGGEIIRPPKPGQWQSLQLTLDLKSRTFSGSVGVPGEVAAFDSKPFAAAWAGVLSFVTVDSSGAPKDPHPALDLDNIAVQEAPIPPVSTTPPGRPAQDSRLAALNAELDALAGLDGDFELQKDSAPPSKPWNPGPNSVVRISAGSQSPYHNLYAGGNLGLHMPNSGDYNGFGVALPAAWKAETTEHLFVSFDFRCAGMDAGGSGSWRYYLGHGPGNSAAVELFFNGSGFFRRSGNAHDAVQPLKIGEWYQVQAALNLKERSYTGFIASASSRTEFTGRFPAGWDGNIDYAFIDSYGHIGGVKPALDADNFAVGTNPLPSFGAAEVRIAGDGRASRKARIEELRQQAAQLSADEEKRRREARARFIAGPVDLAYGVSEGTPHDARIQIRGEPDKPGEEVRRGFIKSLGHAELPHGTTGSGRLELAQWLTRADNPLTARVMVNRLWQYHFGRGLVRTANDFGTRSEPPAHPELLDFLAVQFVQRGWSLKTMHRLIMLSAAYQQESENSDNMQAPGLFTPFPRRRLSAEEIRDSILAVSGELDETPGTAHPFPPPDSWGFTQHAPFNAVYDHNKRSVYLMVQRIKRHPFLALFDGADPNASTSERRITTVPTQALFFLNDPFVHTKALKCAERLISANADGTSQIERASRLTLGRPPTAKELAEAMDFLAAYRAELTAAGHENPGLGALAAYVRTLFGSNEFLHPD